MADSQTVPAGSDKKGEIANPIAEPSPFVPEEKSDLAKILIIGAIGVVLSMASDLLRPWLCEKFPHAEGLVSAIAYGLEHLGVVLVVAMVVKFAIENESQRQFFRRVTARLTSSIDEIKDKAVKPMQDSIAKVDEDLGFAIRREGLLDPDSLRLLKEKVWSPIFIRPEYTLTLRLEPVRDGAGEKSKFLTVYTRASFKVKNITRAPAKYTIDAWVDDIIRRDELPPAAAAEPTCKLTRFAFGRDEFRNESDLRPFDLAQLEKEGKIKKESDALRLQYELQEDIKPGETYYVDIEAAQVMRTHDVFVWNMGALTQKFTVSIEFANGFTVDDFRVDAREMHHLGPQAFRDSFVKKDNVLSWSINQVLLPYQGVEIFWAPNHPAALTPALNELPAALPPPKS